MTTPRLTRYEVVSRRALLKASLGAAALAAVPGLGCGNDDTEVLGTELVRPAPTTTVPPATSSTTPVVTTAASNDASISDTENQQPAVEDAPADPTADSVLGGVAVNGEMVISFTYTQGVGGKDEPPYVAVWIENAAGDLVETVALWYEQGRRGNRWIDHLTRWYDLNLEHVAAGGTDDTVTISSATRAAGSYAVVWDGAIDGTPAPAGEYHVCVEAVREDGPYSLSRQLFTLGGTLAPSALPDDGELSAVAVRIDV